MQTIFEIFDPVTGITEGYMDATARDRYIRRMDAAGYVRDWLPSSGEGFWIVNMGGNVKGGNFDTREQAENTASMLNMGSDTNSFHVVEHTL